MELINRTKKVCTESIIQSIQYQNCRMVLYQQALKQQNETDLLIKADETSSRLVFLCLGNNLRRWLGGHIS
jgi:hypothetical protein